jgi:hypothetical protein
MTSPSCSSSPISLSTTRACSRCSTASSSAPPWARASARLLSVSASACSSEPRAELVELEGFALPADRRRPQAGQRRCHASVGVKSVRCSIPQPVHGDRVAAKSAGEEGVGPVGRGGRSFSGEVSDTPAASAKVELPKPAAGRADPLAGGAERPLRLCARSPNPGPDPDAAQGPGRTGGQGDQEQESEASQGDDDQRESRQQTAHEEPDAGKREQAAPETLPILRHRSGRNLGMRTLLRSCCLSPRSRRFLRSTAPQQWHDGAGA